MADQFTNDQMQHLVNIVLACERWARLEASINSFDNDFMSTEAKLLHDRANAYNKYMLSEMAVLSGRPESDPFIDDFYNYMNDINENFD